MYNSMYVKYIYNKKMKGFLIVNIVKLFVKFRLFLYKKVKFFNLFFRGLKFNLFLKFFKFKRFR